MIYVDMEKEEMEYNCSGATMVAEISTLLATSLYEGQENGVYDKAFGDRADALIDTIAETIGETTKMMYHMLVERKDEWDDEEEDDEEKRSNEAIRTVIKQYRRGRTKRNPS